MSRNSSFQHCKYGLVVGIFALVGVLGLPGQASAQGKSDAHYLTQAVTRVTGLADVVKRGNYGYSDSISMMAGWVNSGKNVTFDITLRGGVDYLFLAGGDQDAEDVDLEILDNTGRVLVQDVRTDPEAIVYFRPNYNGRYTMRLTLYKSRDNLPCVCVATVLRKGGWEVPFTKLDQAMANMNRILQDVDQKKAQPQGRRLYLHKSPNQWAVFGAVVEQGQEASVINMDLAFGDRLLVGVGDDGVTSLDVFLLNRQDRVLRNPEGPQNSPWIFHRSGGGGYGMRITNRGSRGASVVMMGVMDMR